ncbi:hypothetical protein BgiMline_015980 [Biomphalaria glabrata]|nr:hypothetical protein BgiMline_008786 [Biomphalaria glabrata]KAI8791653.1 hypothetical protein BgiBS90_007117 [Biomphalaria glabrata]
MRLIFVLSVLAMTSTLSQGQFSFCDLCPQGFNRLCTFCVRPAVVTKDCICGISDPESIECLTANQCDGVGK